jgi:hypothetical protein
MNEVTIIGGIRPRALPALITDAGKKAAWFSLLINARMLVRAVVNDRHSDTTRVVMGYGR